MKGIKAASFIAISLASGGAFADWLPSQLDSLANAFSAGISSQFTVSKYPFSAMNTANCFGTDPTTGLPVTCANTNPASPYSFPKIPTGNFGTSLPMAPADAQVLIWVTPPGPLLYYSVTPYLLARYYSAGVEANGQNPGTYGNVFESIGDSINSYEVRTAGSTAAGGSPFSQLSVMVMAGDSNTKAAIRSELISLGFPPTAINYFPMPETQAPLRMKSAGTTNPDTFMMMLRTAYPQNQTVSSALYSYYTATGSNSPFRFMQLSSLSTQAYSQLSVSDKVPGSGTSESQTLSQARDDLATLLTTQYGASYIIHELSPHDRQTNNYVYMNLGISAEGDNPDAVYTDDVDNWTPLHAKDKVLIVGVDHVATGKAVYISHAIYDATHQVGIAGIADTGAASQSSPTLAGSAVAMAGITSSDPRYSTYMQLYAFVTGEDCSTGEPVCLQIPQISAPPTCNPLVNLQTPGSCTIGVLGSDPISISGRAYVDPVTLTRPSTNEIIEHRVFKMIKK